MLLVHDILRLSSVGKYGEGQLKTILDIKARHLLGKLASECRQKIIFKINKVHININVNANIKKKSSKSKAPVGETGK